MGHYLGHYLGRYQQCYRKDFKKMNNDERMDAAFRRLSAELLADGIDLVAEMRAHPERLTQTQRDNLARLYPEEKTIMTMTDGPFDSMLTDDQHGELLYQLIYAAGEGGISEDELMKQADIAVCELASLLSGAAIWRSWSERKIRLSVKDGQVCWRRYDIPPLPRREQS